MLDIHGLMADLSKHHPSFRLEVDFQQALVQQILKAMPNSEPHLEHYIKNMRLDIYLPTDRIAMELKCRLSHRGVRVGRYDFLKDIQKLERVVREGKAESGFAVLLTNVHRFWCPPQRGWKTTTDAAFRLHEGRPVTGALTWADWAKPIKDRKKPICLKSSYLLQWRDYSSLGTDKNQQFRYLAVSVK
ncbi:hypothetical protein F4X33_03115 [Candidatus Poribacteria bacterium]|nr:hypothetical protein [Candidatus Poribacteria bacterium]